VLPDARHHGEESGEVSRFKTYSIAQSKAPTKEAAREWGSRQAWWKPRTRILETKDGGHMVWMFLVTEPN